jgi:hypothetical protein
VAISQINSLILGIARSDIRRLAGAEVVVHRDRVVE